MSTLFISHSSRDAAQARSLQERLVERGYGSLFLDLDPEKGIQAGTSWERTLYTKLRACRAVIALCTDNYLASKWCFAEIALARMEGKEIFALQMKPWSRKTELPSILTEQQYIDLRQATPKKVVEESYRRLWNGLEAKGIVPEEQRVWSLEDPPYPGLRAFDEADAPIFFGRDRAVREGVELLNRVRRLGHPRAVMVLGSSGSGKSSLARAGILPQLRADDRQWLVVGPFRPGRHPTRELAAALAAAFDNEGAGRSWEQIHHQLMPPSETSEVAADAPSRPQADPNREARRRLLEALLALEGEISEADARIVDSVRQLREFFKASSPAPVRPPGEQPPASTGSPLADLCTELRLLRAPSTPSVVLFIDQFEELLGHEKKGPGHSASRFLDLLAEGLESDDHPPLLLATMRSDYLGTLQKTVPLRGVGFKSLSVGPMSPEGMRQVIEEPAKLGQIELEDGLADRLLADTGTSDALPLLAFTLRTMWDRYRQDRLLDIREYEEMGGLHGAIAQVAEETYETALAPGQEQELRNAFLSLARPTEEGSGWARQPQSWDELPESVATMLEPFVKSRLLVKRGDGTVEVAHEALFQSWERFSAWLRTNSEALHLHREIQVDATKWLQATTEEEKDPYLWRGGRLARARELRESGVLALKELERSFIDAAESAEQARIDAETARQRRELRRTRIFAAFMAVALVVVVLGALQIRRQARRTLSRQLAAQSSQLLDQQLDRALLVALAAGRVDDTIDAERALLAAVQHNPRLWRYLHRPGDGPGDPIRSVALSADGSTLATVAESDRLTGGGSSVLLWSVEDGVLMAGPPLELPGTKEPVAAFSPDGRRLAVGGVDRTDGEQGRLHLWDLGPEAPIQRDGPPPDGVVNDLAFCGRPRSTLAWATKTQVFLRHPDETTEEVVPPGGPLDLGRLAFAPDCSCLAIGDETRGNIVFSELAGPRPAEATAAEAPTSPQGSGSVCPVVTLEGPTTHDSAVPPNRQGIRDLAFAPAGNQLAAARVDGTIDLWNLDSATTKRLGRPGEPVEAIAYRPDGTLLSAGRDGGVVIWSPSTDPPTSERLPGHEGKVNGLAAGRGGLLASVGEDGKAILWRLDRKQRLADLLEGHQQEVWAVAFDPAGERLVSGDKHERVKVWDLATGMPTDLEDNVERGEGLAAPDPQQQGTNGVDFSSDGNLVAAAGGDDGNLRLWRLVDKRRIWHWSDGRAVSGVRFSPTERILAAGANNQIVFWDLGAEPSNGTPSAPTALPSPASHKTDIWALLYGDDGRSLLASDTGGGLLVWDVENRQSRPLIPSPGSKTAVLKAIARSADGKLVAAGGKLGRKAGGKGCVRLWEISGRPVSYDCLPGHDQEVLAVAFGPGDRTLFVADLGANLMVWDVARRKFLGPLRNGHEPGKVINSLALGSGGRLASASDDTRIAIWDLDWRAVACDVARRDLDKTEWKEYVGHTGKQELCPGLAEGAPAVAPLAKTSP